MPAAPEQADERTDDRRLRAVLASLLVPTAVVEEVLRFDDFHVAAWLEQHLVRTRAAAADPETN